MSVNRSPQVGDWVHSLAGSPVGRVVAVHDSFFKVRCEDRDLVLDMDAFYMRAGMGVTQLVCNADGLARYIRGGNSQPCGEVG